MNWFTCSLEKYPEGTKSKYSGYMGHWRKGSDPFHCYEFCYKQRMVPMIFDSKDKVNNKRLSKEYQRNRIRSHDLIQNLDLQHAKEFRIWDYGCQFIKFYILDWRYFPSLAYRNESCSLRIDSTDDSDWEIEFNPSKLEEVMKFVQKNWRNLTLNDLENLNNHEPT